MIVIAVFSAIKLALTSVLYVTSVRFASQLKKIMVSVSREYGLEDQHVKRLAMTYWFVKWLVIMFIIGDLTVNVLKPIIFIFIVNGNI